MHHTGSILVVDNESTISDLILDTLTDEGYIAYSALDGRGALTAITQHPPALMLLDPWLPDMSGAELIAQICLADLVARPIVLMSTTLEAIASLLVSQPLEYLIKPFELDDLIACVARYVQLGPAAKQPSVLTRAASYKGGIRLNIACSNETVVSTVRGVLLEHGITQVRQQGPNFGDPMIWVLANVHVTVGNDKESAARRAIARIDGATIHS